MQGEYIVIKKTFLRGLSKIKEDKMELSLSTCNAHVMTWIFGNIVSQKCELKSVYVCVEHQHYCVLYKTQQMMHSTLAILDS